MKTITPRTQASVNAELNLCTKPPNKPFESRTVATLEKMCILGDGERGMVH